jgi:hypothetical protein
MEGNYFLEVVESISSLSVVRKYVNVVGLGQDRIETKAIPMIIADFTLYIMSKVVMIPPQNMPIQTYSRR